MEDFLKRVQRFLLNLTARQKILLGVSAAVLIGVALLSVRLTQSADYKTLYSGLAVPDAQTVAQNLAAKNIPYEISTDGTSISVPADQLDKTRLALAAEGMPPTGRLGFELFDKPNWAGSDFSEQVNYQRALEGELERTIQTLGNVESVRVHLVLPHDSLFTDRERTAKAAVVLKVRGGGLTDDQVNAVTHLVASAVDNLAPQDVTLIGADGRSPLVAQGHDGIKGMDASADLEASMAEKLVATLAPVVGADHVKASVTAAYDESSGETTQELYDPNNTALVTAQIQDERFGGAPPAGIPGTASNTPSGQTGAANGASGASGTNGANGAAKSGAPASAQTPASNQNQNAGKAGALQANPQNPILSMTSDSDGQHSESRTYAVSKTTRHTIDPPGRVQKIAAAVLIDDAIEEKKDAQGQVQQIRRKRTPEEMKQIEDLARAAMGFDATRGDELSVQNISFVNAPEENPSPRPIAERVRMMIDDWMWLARYVMLGMFFALIYLLVLRPVKNQLMNALEAGGFGTPALSGASASAGAAALAGESAALAQPLELDAGVPSTEVERVIRMKRQLAQKVKAEPTAASQLVRHWIKQSEKP